MARVDLQLPQTRGFGGTSRRDRWWLQPAIVFMGLGAFVVYSTFAAFLGVHYFHDAGGAQYLSPFYSPVLFDPPGLHSGHAWFGTLPGWWPSWLPYSPALLILWAPAGFRLTCYYYRGAYYKAFWADPPSCAVGEPRKGYLGENAFPLKIQNIHRYFMYIALLFLIVLSYDAIISYWFVDPASGEKHFGVGVGSLVLTLNVILLSGYAFGCHSLRHILGGRLDCFSKSKVQSACYGCVSAFNKRHMLWAWTSLFMVGFADFYVWMVATGRITDVRFF